MENNSRENDAVYDPFLGSGTSVIAAEQIGRICFGLEIDPKYVDVIVKRWQNFTGANAILSNTKLIFDDVAKERMVKSNGRKRTKTQADGAAHP